MEGGSWGFIYEGMPEEFTQGGFTQGGFTQEEDECKL